MTFILRMIVREMRASWRRLLFFFLCIAVGVGAIVALRSVIQSVRQTFAGEARALITADAIITSNQALMWSALRRVGIRPGDPQREQAAMRVAGQARLYGRGVVRLRSWRSAVCRFRRAGPAPLPCAAFLRPVRAAGQARLYGAIRFP